MAIHCVFEAIVHHYQTHYLGDTRAEIEWFQSQATLKDAIVMATLAENHCGKRYAHQRIIRQGALLNANNYLSPLEDQIKGSENFNSLWLLIDRKLKLIRGIGELYRYDTAFRIGAYLDLLPEKVYLHAGTRAGARTLIPTLGIGATSLEVAYFPEEFQRLQPYEIEDILCIYKRLLVEAMKQGT